MKMKRFVTIAILISCVLSFLVSTSMAAENEDHRVKIIGKDGTERISDTSGNKNMELRLGDYMSDNPKEDSSAFMPQMKMVLGIGLSFLVFVVLLNIIMGGSFTNIGEIIRNNGLRKSGFTAIGVAVFSVLIVSVALMVVPALYNRYVVGALT